VGAVHLTQITSLDDEFRILQLSTNLGLTPIGSRLDVMAVIT
jgi:hypothetical protein